MKETKLDERKYREKEVSKRTNTHTFLYEIQVQ